MSPPLLAVDDIYAGYQDFDILKGVTLVVHPGEIVCVIGPNGAGKSTVFNAIYGFLKVRQGAVRFDGQEITNARPRTCSALASPSSPSCAASSRR